MSTNNGVSESEKLRVQLQEALQQLAELRERVAGLEQLSSLSGAESVPVAAKPVEAAAAEPSASGAPTKPGIVAEAGITEEEILAISAAVAAWLGVQAHIRQIRLIRTGAWAQQGRVTIQASHRLNH